MRLLIYIHLGSGAVDFDEFCQMMAKQLAAGLREELKEALNAFSPGGSISENEWKKILGSLAEKMSNDEVDSLLKQADKSGRGNIKHEGMLTNSSNRFLFAMPKLG